LLWAPPGTEKTYFVGQVAESSGIRYHEINLAKLSDQAFREQLDIAVRHEPSLIFIDEIDAKPDVPWPYELLLPCLDLSADHGARIVFVLAGSSGASLQEMTQAIKQRPKGADLLSRIPDGHKYAIPPLSIGDQVLVFLQQLGLAARRHGRAITEVEKLALFYVLMQPGERTARPLRDMAARAIERIPPADDRLVYDNLFDPGDGSKYEFYSLAAPHDAIVRRFVRVQWGALAATEAISSGKPTRVSRQLTGLAQKMLLLAMREHERLALATFNQGSGWVQVGTRRFHFPKARRALAELTDSYPPFVKYWKGDLYVVTQDGAVAAEEIAVSYPPGWVDERDPDCEEIE
jgi:hypothetical protein